MIEEQKAKALFAGGVALFVTGLVVLMLFVIPAAQHTQVAVAQEDAAPPPPGEDMEGMPPEPGMPPGVGMPGEGMPGEGMPGGAGAAAAPAPEGMVADPLEPSRPNPFAAGGRAAGAEVSAAVAAPHYGPDWSQLPIAERVGFVTPDIPDAPTPPVPRIERAPEADIRITSILWDASGGAIAAYEGPEGDTGELRPGDPAPGTGMRVQEITRTGVNLENPRTGETVQLEIRPRVEKKEEPRPQRRPRDRRGGQTGGGGGNTPAAPPGGF